MKKRYIILICLLGGLWGACGDFLTEESHELLYARDCKDMEELLIGNGYTKGHSKVALQILREDEKVRELFANLYA